MSQQLLHDPRIVQLDRIKPVVASPEPGELVRLPLVRRAFIISRISRDQTLIDGLEFGELCKQHRVLIVMPTMRLNL